MLTSVITPEMHYDDWAAQYDGDVRGWDYHAPDKVVEKIRPLLWQNRQSQKILDVGIGTGLVSERCRQIHDSLHVAGVDVSSQMLRLCEQKNVADELHRVDVSSDIFPFESNMFDIVAAAGVMENVEHIDHAVTEMMRVTRPGGHVIFTFMPTRRAPFLEVCRKAFRPGRTTDGKFVMGRLNLFRHNPHSVVSLARTTGAKLIERESFIGYRTFVLLTVMYDVLVLRKIDGLQ